MDVLIYCTIQECGLQFNVQSPSDFLIRHTPQLPPQGTCAEIRILTSGQCASNKRTNADIFSIYVVAFLGTGPFKLRHDDTY